MTREDLFSHDQDCWVLIYPKLQIPLHGTLGFIDWYTNGLISASLQKSKIKSHNDQGLMLSPGPLLPPKQIILFDGSDTNFSPKMVSQTLEKLGKPSCWILGCTGVAESAVSGLKKFGTVELEK